MPSEGSAKLVFQAGHARFSSLLHNFSHGQGHPALLTIGRPLAIVAASPLRGESSHAPVTAATAHITAAARGQEARVPHLVRAPRDTTALAGPHRLMPVLVPAVVPLVPSNKANESSLHGAAFLQNRHYAYRHPVYMIEALTSGTVNWSSSRLLTKLLTNRFDLDRSSRYSGGRSPRSAQLPSAGGSWLTRKKSRVSVKNQSCDAAAATNSSRRGSIRSWPNETTFVRSQ